jgi:hypothetical protein
VVVAFSGGTLAAVIVNDKFTIALCCGLAESFTVNVNAAPLTAAVGVPLIVPVELNVRPAGSVPLVNVHAYGAVPPVAASVAVYAAPTCPFASDVVVTASGDTLAAVIVSVRFTVAFCCGLPASFAVNVNAVALATAVGVPLIVPVELSVRPAGSVPLVNVHAYGVVPPVAASVALYAAPICPFARDVVVTVRVDCEPPPVLVFSELPQPLIRIAASAMTTTTRRSGWRG